MPIEAYDVTDILAAFALIVALLFVLLLFFASLMGKS